MARASKLLFGVAPMARTDEEREKHPEGVAIESALERLATERAQVVQNRTLAPMAWNDLFVTDEAGQWIRAAYSYSAHHGLPTPAGNDPIEEYTQLHAEMYGLIRLGRLKASLQRRLTGQDPKLGRPAKGIAGNALRSVLRAVFTEAELEAIPLAAARGRHRTEPQIHLLHALGLLANAIKANVEALKSELDITRSTIYRLLEEARLYAQRLAALEAKVDTLARSHSRLESVVQDRLAEVMHGPMVEIAEDDPRSVTERLDAFLERLTA